MRHDPALPTCVGEAESGEAPGLGAGESEETQARLGEFVDGGFGDSFGCARVESKEAEESAGDGAERDLGVRDPPLHLWLLS